MDRAMVERILKHIGEDTAEPLVREGAGPLRRVGVTAEMARGARAAREGDACQQGVDRRRDGGVPYVSAGERCGPSAIIR